MRRQLRQGDVLLIEVDRVPEGATPIKREQGRIVLAHGEATGHAHTVASRAAEFLERDGRRYLSTPKAAVLEHQEHDPGQLEAGKVYEVVRQREYHPEAIRNVSD